MDLDAELIRRIREYRATAERYREALLKDDWSKDAFDLGCATADAEDALSELFALEDAGQCLFGSAVAFEGFIYARSSDPRRLAVITGVVSDDGTLARFAAEAEESRKASDDARREGASDN